MNTVENIESPLVSNRDTAPAYWLLGALWVILVDGEQSGGRFSIMEQWVRGPGPGPPLHVHGFSDECLYILDGQMEIRVGQKQMMAGAGQSVWIPRRTVHGFNVMSEVLHFLNSYTPAGFEQAVKGLAKPAERREIPPPMHDGHLIHKLQSNGTHIALSALVRRLVNPRLVADPPPYRELASLRGPKHLAVTFDDLRD